MIPIRGIVVSVNYDDLLAITLARNMRHLTECLVVTAPTDHATHKIVSQVPGARLYATNAFYRDGAKFNKGAAMEEGFAALGRGGQILIWDADILLPDNLRFPKQLERDMLYGAPRRILNDPKKWHPDFNWNAVPIDKDPTVPGYFQLFNAESKFLQNTPWYDPGFTHAGGADAVFMMRFKQRQKLPFDVLHLGPHNQNWFGRVSERMDGQEIPEASVQERISEMQKLERSRGATGRLPWERVTKGFPVG